MEIYGNDGWFSGMLTENSKISMLRRLPTLGSTGRPKIKMVQFDNDPPLEYVLGTNGDYWRNGLPLMSVLQTAANAGNSKVKIF